MPAVQVLKRHDFSRAENTPKGGWALQAAEKLVRAVGQGFIPGIRSESTRALAPEGCLSAIAQDVPPSLIALISGGLHQGISPGVIDPLSIMARMRPAFSATSGSQQGL